MNAALSGQVQLLGISCRQRDLEIADPTGPRGLAEDLVDHGHGRAQNLADRRVLAEHHQFEQPLGVLHRFVQVAELEAHRAQR
ncbi:MAG: hypothetical protein U0527_18040 [Candidatus Eisenbacteria bacterium]